MKRLLIILLTVSLATAATGCTPDKPPPLPEIPETTGNGDDGDENSGDADNPKDPGANEENADNMKLTIKVGSTLFMATLVDNETTAAFKKMLPMRVIMSEHAGNEKYYVLPNGLPTATLAPGTIHRGDIMLYGSSTLVVFYKTFRSPYFYTRIGAVDNPAGLEEAVGGGSVTVIFEPIVE